MNRFELPNGYPSGLNDYEIQKYVKNAIQIISNKVTNPFTISDSSDFKDVADLGISELNMRAQSRQLQNIEHLNTQITTLNKQIDHLNQENKKSGKVNRMMTIITIVLACISIGLSWITVFPAQDKEKEQIEARKMDLLRMNMEELKENNYLLRQKMLKDEMKELKVQPKSTDTK